jgi:hypothetical protein
MGRRRNVEIRGAQELKSAMGKANQQKGQAMRDIKMLQDLNLTQKARQPKRNARAEGREIERPPLGGIRLGS